MKKYLKSLLLLPLLVGTISCDLFNGSETDSNENSINNSSNEITETKYEVNKQEWIEAFSIENHKNVTVDMEFNYSITSGFYKNCVSADYVFKFANTQVDYNVEGISYSEVDKAKFISQQYEGAENIPMGEELDKAIIEYFETYESNIISSDDTMIKIQVGKLNDAAYCKDLADENMHETYEYNSRLNGYVASREIGTSVEAMYDSFERYSNNLYLRQFYDFATYNDADKSYIIDGSKLPCMVFSSFSHEMNVMHINESKIQYFFENNKLSKIVFTPLNGNDYYIELNYLNLNNTVIEEFKELVVICEHYYQDSIHSLNDDYHGKYCYYCGDYEYEKHKFYGKYCQVCRHKRYSSYEEIVSIQYVDDGDVVLVKDEETNEIVGVKLYFDYQQIIEQSISSCTRGFVFYGSNLYVVMKDEYGKDYDTRTLYFYNNLTNQEVHEPITYSTEVTYV